MNTHTVRHNLKYFTHNKLESVDFMSVLNQNIEQQKEVDRKEKYRCKKLREGEFQTISIDEEKVTKPVRGKRVVYKSRSNSINDDIKESKE